MFRSEGIERFLRSLGGSRHCIVSGKIKYKSQEGASEALAGHGNGYGRMQPYQCRACGNWHLGHRKRRTE